MSANPPSSDDNTPHRNERIALEDRNAADDGRLHSPSAARNRDAVTAALAPHLTAQARVFEVGSGTGEHGAHICAQFPGVTWLPSDPDPRSRHSITAWADAAPNENLRPPLALMTTDADWPAQVRAHFPDGPDVIFSMNMIHISPWASCTGLFAGAGALLSIGGKVFLYGPFLEGADTAPSNLDFDASLRRRNPDWGVRALSDVTACAEGQRFFLVDRIEMPANNLSLIFEKRP